MAPSSKRPAPRTPEGRRPKRQQTSSPEEGEVDDSNAPASPKPRSRTPPLLPSHNSASSSSKFRVPFPFKNKGGPGKQALSLQDRISPRGDTWLPGERSFERDRREVEDAPVRRRDRRNSSSHGRKGGMKDSWSSNADHYEPRSSSSSRRDRDRDRDRTWSAKSRSRSPRGRKRARTPSVSPPYAPRSPSPRSSSPPSRHSRERAKHRLPTPRVSAIMSPYDNYSRELYRDRDRDPRGQYQRAQEWEGSKWAKDESRFVKSPMYRPRSPSPPPRTGFSSLSTPPPPRSPHPDGARTPSGPPPPPPPTSDPSALVDHAAVSIKLKASRPGAPLETRTPPSMSFSGPGTRKSTPAPPKVAQTKDELVQSTTPVVKKKRSPVRRTREEEKEAYGRVFLGCGQRDDYDMMTKLGEGTFGEVHKAMHKTTKQLVALKRILMHNEKEGMPVTALREIKILKALHHPCVLELLDMFIIPSQGKNVPMSVYMVSPYMDHDLAGLLENERVKLTPSQIKLYMKQLLEGTEYMHHNNILHRDMKAANLLISNNGSLRIADFGLARAFDPSITRRTNKSSPANKNDRRYTNCVVTRWYRPPELLLGARQYGGEIDVWGIGCVLGEMFMRRPILPGSTDLDQLDRIWAICGSPNQQNWPDYDKLPGCEGQIRFRSQERRIKDVYESLGKETCDLLDKLLTLDPRERITASAALDHEYFWSDPLPADPKSLPSYESSHEFDQRGRRHHHQEAQKPAPLHPNPQFPHQQNGMLATFIPPNAHPALRRRLAPTVVNAGSGNAWSGAPSRPPLDRQESFPGIVAGHNGIPNIPPGSRGAFNQQVQYPNGRPPLPMYIPYADSAKEYAQREMTRKGLAPPGGFAQGYGVPLVQQHQQHSANIPFPNPFGQPGREEGFGPGPGRGRGVGLPPRPHGLPPRPTLNSGHRSGNGGGRGRPPPVNYGSTVTIQSIVDPDGDGGLNYG